MTIADPDVSVESVVAKETASGSAKKALSSPWASLAAVVIAVLWTIPTAGLLISSFRPEDDVKTSGWWTGLTGPFTTENYRAVMTGSDTDLATYFVNTIVITIPAVIIPVCLAVIAAYAFSWMKFPGRDFLFVCVFALQIVPIQVTMIPLLRLYVQPPFNLQPLAGGDAPGGGFYTIWLSHSIFALPLAIYLLHNFMSQIPGELIESARVDGAGLVQTYARIILPISISGFVVTLIWQFTSVWNDFLFALFLTQQNNGPVTLGLAALAGGQKVDYAASMAGALITSLPTLLVYILLGRWFIGGLMAGALKG